MKVFRILIVLLLCTLAIPALGMALLTAGAPTTPFELPTYVVETGSLEQAISTLGRVEANRSASLTFAISGTVESVAVKVGDTVQVGQVLMALDAISQEAAVQQAEVAVQQAETSLQDLRLTPRPEQIENAQAAVASAQGGYSSVANATRPEDIAAAEERYNQALQRVQDLQRGRVTMPGELATQQYSLQEAQIGQATFDAEIARLRLEALRRGNPEGLWEAGANVQLAQLQYEQLLAGPAPIQFANAEIALQRAQSRLLDAQTALSRTRLTSPISGVITRVDAVVGQVATPDRVVVEIADLSMLWLTANVDELDVDSLYAGLPADIRLDALPGESFTAQVGTIALVSTVRSNGVITYPTRFQITTADERIRPGMTAEVRILLAQRENVLVVPSAFIRAENGQTFVTLQLPNGSLQDIAVGVGLQSRDAVEIINGLRQGDVLVLNTGEITS